MTVLQNQQRVMTRVSRIPRRSRYSTAWAWRAFRHGDSLWQRAYGAKLKGWYDTAMPEDGPVVQPDGGTIWYRNGIVHRDEDPAIERADGTREWYSEGIRHCETGPALIRPDGKRRWFIHGKELPEAEFKEMRQRISDEIADEFTRTGAKRRVPVFPKPLKPKPKP
jgi:hypothetical protein